MNRVLRKIFGSKMDEVTGEWGRLHKEKLNDLYSSPNVLGVIKKSEKYEMGAACSTYGGEARCIQGFGGKTKGERPAGRSRRRWVYNIKMNLQDVGWRERT